MINVIPVRVSFKNNTLTKKSIVVVEGDYNTTKLVFEFEEDVTNKQIKFGMTNPQGELVMYCGLINNEIILSTEDIDGKVSSVFSTDGLYTFRVFLIGENGESQLSSATGYLPVDQSQVQTGMKAYGPFIDNLMRQVDNLDIDMIEEEGVPAIKITRKDGSTEVCKIVIDMPEVPEAVSEITENSLDPVNSVAVINHLKRLGVPIKTSYVWDIADLRERDFHGRELVSFSPTYWPLKKNGSIISYIVSLRLNILIASFLTEDSTIHAVVESPIPQDAIKGNIDDIYVDPEKFSLSAEGYSLGVCRILVPDGAGGEFWIDPDEEFSDLVDGQHITEYKTEVAVTQHISAGGVTPTNLRLAINFNFVTAPDVSIYNMLVEEFTGYFNLIEKLKLKEEIQPQEHITECGVIGG